MAYSNYDNTVKPEVGAGFWPENLSLFWVRNMDRLGSYRGSTGGRF